MNLSPSWVEVQEDAGIEAQHWSTVGEGGASDREIFEWARRHDYVLLSHDLDFSRLLALTGSRGPSVVQLRSHRVLPSETAFTVIQVLRQHEKNLVQGAVVVVDPDGSRARLLPLREPS